MKEGEIEFYIGITAKYGSGCMSVVEYVARAMLQNKLIAHSNKVRF